MSLEAEVRMLVAQDEHLAGGLQSLLDTLDRLRIALVHAVEIRTCATALLVLWDDGEGDFDTQRAIALFEDLRSALGERP